MDKQDQLRKQNNSMKQRVEQIKSNMQNLISQVQAMIPKHKFANNVFRGLLASTNRLQKCNQLLQAMSSRLIEKQIQKNTSADCRALLKMYEQKIREFRMKIHGKQLHHESYLYGFADNDEEPISQVYVPPLSHHVRKFNIELVAKQNIEKMIDSLAKLKIVTPDRLELQQENTAIGQTVEFGKTKKKKIEITQKICNKNIITTDKQYESLGCILEGCIAQQQKRFESLSQKYGVLQNVLTIVNRDNRALQQEFNKDKNPMSSQMNNRGHRQKHKNNIEIRFI